MRVIHFPGTDPHSEPLQSRTILQLRPTSSIAEIIDEKKYAPAPIRSMVASPDGSFLAVAYKTVFDDHVLSRRGGVAIWNLEESPKVRSLTNFYEYIKDPLVEIHAVRFVALHHIRIALFDNYSGRVRVVRERVE